MKTGDEVFVLDGDEVLMGHFVTDFWQSGKHMATVIIDRVPTHVEWGDVFADHCEALCEIGHRMG